MANVFKLPELHDKVSRNSFDLSSKVLFTSKFGEILPVKNIKCFPGDKFKIKVSDLIRTADMSSFCSTRMRQYFNIYFVPTRLLWRYYPQFITNMSDGANQASNIQSPVRVGTSAPHFSFQQLFNAVNLMAQSVPPSIYDSLKDLKAAPFVNGASKSDFPNTKPVITNSNVILANRYFNYYGFSRYSNAQKLLQYLGYYAIKDGRNAIFYNQGTAFPSGSEKELDYNVDAFPLLAYQKIYNDFYRNNQWEGVTANTFNVDYLSPESPKIDLSPLFRSNDPSQGFASGVPSMLDLRYCRYLDDVYTSVKPSAQFGGTAYFDITSLGIGTVPEAAVMSRWTSPESGEGGNTFYNAGNIGSDFLNADSQTGIFKYANGLSPSKVGELHTEAKNVVISSSSRINALQLRLLNTLQRFRELIQSNDYDYKSQIKAIFNVDVSNTLSGLSEYIGGFGIDINSNAVENTNLTDNSVVSIGAYGIGSGQDEFSYNVKEHGYLMITSHAVPIAEYDVKGFQQGFFDIDYSDQPIPALDNLGLEPSNLRYLQPVRANTSQSQIYSDTTHFGYQVRYASIKTDIDILLGNFNSNGMFTEGFAHPSVLTNSPNNGALYSHALRLDGSNFPLLADYYNFRKDDDVNTSFIYRQAAYNAFLVNPSVVDSIFVPQADSSIQTDVLNHYCYFDIKAVRNFSRSGMPF